MLNGGVKMECFTLVRSFLSKVLSEKQTLVETHEEELAMQVELEGGKGTAI